jgi:hypothetical protein
VSKGVALTAAVILALGLAFGLALHAITTNRDDIDQVCATTQAQLDRNAATVRRGLGGLVLIRDHPVVARRKNVPGTSYYLARPEELDAAIDRSKEELKTYDIQAC